MIKKLLSMSAFFMACQVLTAQPTVHSFKPPVFNSIAQTEYIDLSDSLDMTITGNNVTWDFSSIDMSGADTSRGIYLNPSQTPFFTNFPSATMVEKTDDGYYTYFKTTDNSIEVLGEYTGFLKSYSNPKVLCQLPLLFGIKQIDTFAGDFQIGNLTNYNKGTNETTYDGFGSVKFNGETYSNLIRIKSHEVEMDSIHNQYTAIITRDNYSFNTTDLIVLFSYEALTVIYLTEGFPPDTTILYSFSVSSTDLSNITTATQSHSTIPGLCIAPNPAQNTLSVFMNNTFENTTAEFINASGISVRTETLSGPSSSIDISDISAGIYLVKFTNGSNQETKRMVKL